MSLIETAIDVAAPEVGVAVKVWTFVKAKALPILLGVAVIGGGIAFALHEWRQQATAKTVATVTANVSSAQNASAADAVATVERNITNEHNITNEVTHAQAAISAAPDAAGADAAGRAGLCAVAAGFCPAPSVQQPGPS
jgi:hypothetical protein